MEMKGDNQFELNFKLNYLILILNHFEVYLCDVVYLKLKGLSYWMQYKNNLSGALIKTLNWAPAPFISLLCNDS